MVLRFLIRFYNFYFSPDRNFARRLRSLLGFTPVNLSIFKLAFYHKSTSNEKLQSIQSNERLEYLGDAILGTIVAEYLFKKYPNSNEGFLTKMRSKIVKRNSLNKIADKMGLDVFLAHYNNTRLSRSMLGNALEALVGAIYLECGYRGTRNYVIHKILRGYLDIHELESFDDNYKSQLLEWCQKNGQTVAYKMLAKYKYEKRDRFKVAVLIDGEKIATADDFNKKSAEQTASEKALRELGIIEGGGNLGKREQRRPKSKKDKTTANHSAEQSGGRNQHTGAKNQPRKSSTNTPKSSTSNTNKKTTTQADSKPSNQQTKSSARKSQPNSNKSVTSGDMEARPEQKTGQHSQNKSRRNPAEKKKTEKADTNSPNKLSTPPNNQQKEKSTSRSSSSPKKRSGQPQQQSESKNQPQSVKEEREVKPSHPSTGDIAKVDKEPRSQDQEKAAAVNPDPSIPSNSQQKEKNTDKSSSGPKKRPARPKQQPESKSQPQKAKKEEATKPNRPSTAESVKTDKEPGSQNPGKAEVVNPNATTPANNQQKEKNTSKQPSSGPKKRPGRPKQQANADRKTGSNKKENTPKPDPNRTSASDQKKQQSLTPQEKQKTPPAKPRSNNKSKNPSPKPANNRPQRPVKREPIPPVSDDLNEIEEITPTELDLNGQNPSPVTDPRPTPISEKKGDDGAGA